MTTREEKIVKMLQFYIGNLNWAKENHAVFSEFNRGRLEAYEDALQMLTGERE
jgi:hypothetical protein